MAKQLEVRLVNSSNNSSAIHESIVHTYPGEYTFDFPMPNPDTEVYNANCYVVRDEEDEAVAFYPSHNVRYIMYVAPQIPVR